MVKTTITIPQYRAQSRNKTTKKHWTYYKKLRDEVKNLVILHSPTDPSIISPAKVTISAYYRAKRCVDTSNIDDKIFVDALMDANILRDDTPLENPEVVKRSFSQCGEDKVVIMIEEI